MRINVPPSGNVSTDTRNLQTAIDALSLGRSGAGTWEWGELGLNGVYYINAPLRTGAGNRKAARIDGGNATIIWRGEKTDDPMLLIGSHDDEASGGLGFGCLVRNLLLVPNKLARGIRIHKQTYCSLLDSVYVYDARQVGVDLVDCWGSVARSLQIKNCHGIALRTTQFNCGAIHGLIVHAYAEDFPAPDDATVLSYDGQPFQTPENQRAAIVCMPQTVTQLIMESCTTFTDLPLIWTGSGGVLDGAWFEGNTVNNAYIVIDGGGRLESQGCWDIASGRGGTIRNVSLSDDGAAMCRAFVELRERTFDVSVTDSRFRGLRQSIIYAAHGKHYGCRVARCGSYANPIPDHQQIQAASDAYWQSEPNEVMAKEPFSNTSIIS